MRQKDHDLDAIVAVSEAVNQSFDLDRVLKIALKTVLNLKGLDAGTIRLRDPDSDALILKASRGLPPHAILKLREVKLGAKFSGLVAKTGKSLVANDISSTPWLSEILEERPDLKSLASVPLVSQGIIVGSMNIYSPNADHFSPRVMRLLEALGIQIGIAVENAKLVEKVQRNVQWFEHILESSALGIATFDADGRLLSLNKAAEKILGIQSEKVQHQNFKQVFADHQKILAAISEGKLREEVICQVKDKGRLYINLRRSSIEDKAGRNLGSIIFLEDITESKKTEEQIQRISKLISLGQLAAGIAHEIRNPLSGISFVLDDIHDSLGKDEERRTLIVKAIKEVDRVDEIVSGLLDFAQVHQFDFSFHNVNEILEEASLLIRTRCKECGVELIKEFGQVLPEIELDPRRLKQAFLNLMINSVDAMEHGGTLRIQTRGYARLTDEPGDQSQFVEVILEDTGTGISDSDYHRIFDPFFTTKPDGAGLGLSITHSIVMEHSGKICVESENGKGSRFIVYLPTNRPRKGGILSVGIESAIDVLDPHRHRGWMTYRVVRNLFEGLVDRDLTRQDVPCAPIVPGLARSWKISSDGRAYTFYLREGVCFHDGTPFDSEAVRFNIARMTDPAAPQYDAEAAQYSGFIWQYLESVETPNPVTVTIRLREPFFEFLAQLTEGGLGSARMLSPAAWRTYGNKGLHNHPIGTGPFKFAGKGKRGEVILEKNYEYWGSKPFLDRLIFKPMPEPATRVAALQTGEVDMIFVPPPDTIEILLKAGFVVNQGPVPHNWYISLNMRDQKMKDPRVRRALNLAIDRDRLAKELLKGTAKVAHGLHTPGCPSYDPRFIDHGYDPEDARRLLAEAGYPEGFEMTLQTATAGSGQLLPVHMAEWIKQDLGRCGIACKLDLHEWIHYIELWAQGIKDGVEANQISWGMSSDYWLEIIAHSRNWAPHGKNSGYYKNVEVDALLDAARLEADEQKRTTIYRQANALITQDAAYIPIVNDLAPIVLNRKIRGFVHAPSEWYDFTTVWVED
jgi:peptide/nickel transport system substrate-binding protein